MGSIYLSDIEITSKTLFHVLTGRSRRKSLHWNICVSSVFLQRHYRRIFLCLRVECLQGSDGYMLHILLLRGSDWDMLHILLLRGSDWDILHILLLRGSEWDMLHTLLLQGSDWDMLHILLLRGSDGYILHILLLQSTNIYITYRIIRNYFQTLSFKIQKDIQFPNVLFLGHKTTEEAQKAIKHKRWNALWNVTHIPEF
jgi:hypothetical protein